MTPDDRLGDLRREGNTRTVIAANAVGPKRSNASIVGSGLSPQYALDSCRVPNEAGRLEPGQRSTNVAGGMQCPAGRLGHPREAAPSPQIRVLAVASLRLAREDSSAPLVRTESFKPAPNVGLMFLLMRISLAES